MGVSRRDKHEAGQTIVVGGEINPCFGYYETGALANSAVGGWRFMHAVGRGAVQRPRGYDRIAAELMNHSVNLSRELLAELVRAEMFADAPSRMTCLWVVANMAEAEAWAETLHHDAPIQIAELSLAGSILECDAGWMSTDINTPFSRARTEMERYWRGEDFPAGSRQEILFAGTARVMKLLGIEPGCRAAGDSTAKQRTRRRNSRRGCAVSESRRSVQ